MEFNFKKDIEEMEKVGGNKKVISAIKKIKDPELDIDIWTLGLIYDISIERKKVMVYMTFTNPMCPYGFQLVQSLKEGLKNIGYDADVEIVFDPIWEPSEKVKEILGLN